MKTSMKSISIILLVLLVVSCVTQQPTREPTSDLPAWYLNPPQADDAIYGVGSGLMSSLDSSRRMAASRAREDIAFQMNAAIEAAITDYAQEAGVDGNNQVVSFVESVSRQVTDVTLQQTRVEQVEQGSDGTIYALVSYSVNNFRSATADAFQRNEDAAFAEFKADQALDALDRQLNENPPQAGNVD